MVRVVGVYRKFELGVGKGRTWAHLNGCTGDLEPTSTRLNLDYLNWGPETRVERYRGCSEAYAGVELWTIEGGRHIPWLRKPAWPEAIVAFLDAHRKP